MNLPIKKPGQSVSAIAIIGNAWGDTAPSWIIALAKECDKTSQSDVARRIDRSPALVNQVLKNTYKADLTAIKLRVETAFGCMIECPVLGLIDGQRCLSEQSQPYRRSNHVTISLFRACPKCPRKLANVEKSNAE